MKIDKSKLITKEQKSEIEFKQLSTQFEHLVQRYLDDAARAKGYDSIATAVSYAEEPAVERFQREGQRLRQWRSLVWSYCYAELDKVRTGARTVPSPDEFLTELPTLA